MAKKQPAQLRRLTDTTSGAPHGERRAGDKRSVVDVLIMSDPDEQYREFMSRVGGPGHYAAGKTSTHTPQVTYTDISCDVTYYTRDTGLLSGVRCQR